MRGEQQIAARRMDEGRDGVLAVLHVHDNTDRLAMAAPARQPVGNMVTCAVYWALRGPGIYKRFPLGSKENPPKPIKLYA